MPAGPIQLFDKTESEAGEKGDKDEPEETA
jgi:hypothetical protein